MAGLAFLLVAALSIIAIAWLEVRDRRAWRTLDAALDRELEQACQRCVASIERVRDLLG